jgi:glycosyltransferase involved in cell wall biosynthesis
MVLPALNEEGAIGGTLRRCLDARAEIQRVAQLDAVEIIVVSDGSTDGTVEIVKGFEDVQLIIFEQNRGYGAAIKAGFAQGTGDLVGFIDADGTCDPLYFGEMCRQILEEGAEVVLGSRMGPDSKMPTIRRVGNVLYAILLGILCGRRVTDTASGMRVIRRGALGMLYPLPDRLHFTPAMSAKALINGLRVVEIPMKYEERIGTSKLNVLKDGIRFLRTIFEGVLCYQPERLFMMAFGFCLLLGILLAAFPVEYYIHNRRIEEWMIYRFVACFLLGTAGFMLASAAVLANKMSALGPKRRGGGSFWLSSLVYLFRWQPLLIFAVVTTCAALILLAPGIFTFVTTGRITLHWSRILVGGFGLLVAFQALITLVMLQVASIWIETAKFHEFESLRRVSRLGNALVAVEPALTGEGL